MELNDLKQPWEQFKTLRKIEGIPERQIFEAMQSDKPLLRRFFSPAMAMYSLVHAGLMVICQSC